MIREKEAKMPKFKMRAYKLRFIRPGSSRNPVCKMGNS